MPHKRAKRSVRLHKSLQQEKDVAPSQQALVLEAIPKGAARILNAAKVQQEYREKKRKGIDDDDAAAGKSNKRRRKGKGGDETKSSSKGAQLVKIQPGESLAHFNRRVEESMRPLVRDAMHTSAAMARKMKKEEDAARVATKAAKSKSKSKGSRTPKSVTPSQEAPVEEGQPNPSPRAQRADAGHAPKEFTSFSTSAPRSINDIVQAPPELSKLPRGAKRSQGAKPAANGSSNLRDGALSMAQKVMLEEERERAVKAYRELKKRQAASG